MAGLDDWGGDGFTQPFELLVESCRESGHLNAVGRRVLRSVVLRHLRNRLYIQAYLKRRPQADERPLGSPLVITGLPRTGTTLLHNLLARDPRHRVLHLWQALHPVPPEDDPEPDEPTLVRQAEAWLERFYTLVPGFRTVHPLTPEGPEECDALLQNAFASQHFSDLFDAEAYSRWFDDSTLAQEYAYYALQLRVLTRDDEPGRRWVLKSPGHIGHLDALLEALPGALVVHCHRDPVEAVPSYASLIHHVRSATSDQVSSVFVGEQALHRSVTALRRAADVRAAVGDSRFFDVDYPALVADPLATTAQVYDWLGVGLDAGAEAEMRRWLGSHPRHRYGVHRYDLADFGLTADRIRAEFDALPTGASRWGRQSGR